jgi:hypothetical protein
VLQLPISDPGLTMRVTFDSQPTPGGANDDYVLVNPDWAVVLDGATALRPDANGCIHDVPWLVRQLAAGLTRALTANRQVPLTDALAEAIIATRGAHESTCDLTNPDSPSSTATILRQRGATLDYLVLGDSPLLLERGREVEAIVDDRMARLDDYSYEAVIKAQNMPDGYYVASTLPDAAYEALHSSIPSADVTAAALLSDGASRLADLYHDLTWRGLFDLLRSAGPTSLISRTRNTEYARGEVNDGRNRKRHDDATAVLLDLGSAS